MTIAVCFKCGEFKFGAFNPCEKCGEFPKTEDELAISLAMTDHYFDKHSLEQMGAATKRDGKPPNLAPETHQDLLKVIRESKTMMPMVENLMKEESDALKMEVKPKPWWRFW